MMAWKIGITCCCVARPVALPVMVVVHQTILCIQQIPRQLLFSLFDSALESVRSRLGQACMRAGAWCNSAARTGAGVIPCRGASLRPRSYGIDRIAMQSKPKRRHDATLCSLPLFDDRRGTAGVNTRGVTAKVAGRAFVGGCPRRRRRRASQSDWHGLNGHLAQRSASLSLVSNSIVEIVHVMQF